MGFAALAAVLANIVNNLPATLVLVPLVAPVGPAAVLAVLIGVNIGPNLTYVGSLSNLLWRSVLRRYDVSASVGEYTRLGLFTVPTSLVAAVLACGPRRGCWASDALARVGRTLRQQMQPNEFAPPALPVAEYTDRKGRNERGQAAGIDVDRVGIAAGRLVDRLDLQRVVPCPQHTAMLMGPDRLGGLVDVDDFDGVPVGG